MLSPELLEARDILNERGAALAIIGGGCGALVYHDPGVKALMDILLADRDGIRGRTAADRVIGRAAAFLYAYGGSAECYGNIVSRTAAEVLERCGIPYAFGAMVEHIENRAKTGLCPMESLMLGHSEPEKAFAALYEFMRARGDYAEPLDNGAEDRAE